MEKKGTKIAYFVALAVVVVALVIAKVTNDGSGFVATGWALFPPVVAIALALISKEVYSSLFLGCVAAALLLANMKDADLAPLEAAAEDVGVSPTGYYTTHTLCDAFLAKCDQARMQSFAPLFEGSADAARAVLAALLPNTFLQALVWHTLTAPEAELLPEVNQNEDL